MSQEKDMTETCKIQLIKNYRNIKESLADDIDSINEILFEKEIISRNTKVAFDDLKDGTQKADDILKIIINGGTREFDVFIDALTKKGHQHLVDKIVKTPATVDGIADGEVVQTLKEDNTGLRGVVDNLLLDHWKLKEELQIKESEMDEMIHNHNDVLNYKDTELEKLHEQNAKLKSVVKALKHGNKKLKEKKTETHSSSHYTNPHRHAACFHSDHQ